MHDFRTIRGANRVQIASELAIHFAQHASCGLVRGQISGELGCGGDQRHVQAILHQGIAALSLAPMGRQYGDSAGYLPGKVEQGCRLACEQLKLQFADGRTLVARDDASDVQRYLDQAAVTPAHHPTGPFKGRDKGWHQRPKDRTVRVKSHPRCSLECIQRQLRIRHGFFPFATLTQCRVATAGRLQGLQPLRSAVTANAPRPQCDALLVQPLIGCVVVNVVQTLLDRLAMSQHGRAAQPFGQA